MTSESKNYFNKTGVIFKIELLEVCEFPNSVEVQKHLLNIRVVDRIVGSIVVVAIFSGERVEIDYSVLNSNLCNFVDKISV